jgi:3-hydroxyacyl-CoA dehydrogenase/enoyl-CoA hydratase/3-hydroxybutyryl-CoA epimerase
MDDRNIRTSLDGDGVLVATIDMPGRSMNVFSAALMDSVERLLDMVAATAEVRAVILTSGKAAFLAGADLDMVRMFTQRAQTDTPAALHALCGRLGRIFRRLETQGKPFVAAINGLALGGGLEVALACHERVASDQAVVGLPEIKLGLLPGAGGTQRLPRLVGQSLGLRLMLKGELRTAAQALEVGIIDAVVPADELLNEARGRASRLAGRGALAPWDGVQWRAPEAGALDTKAQVEDFVASLGIDAEERRLYPAYDAVLDCAMGGWNLPMTEAGHWEMDRFVDLIQNPVAGNMIRALFLDRQRAAKATAGAAQRAPRARVIGARAVEVAAALRAARVAVAEEVESDDGVAIATSASDDAVTIATSAADDGATVATGAPAATRDRSTVAWLRGSLQPPLAFGAAVGVWVGDANSLGRVVEVCIEPGADETLGLDVARWLRATAMVTRGPSLLQRFEATAAAAASYSVVEKLLAVALEAARAWIDGGVLDLGIADSVAVMAGFHPAYTGGPFNYLKQRGATAITDDARQSSARHGARFEVPAGWTELWTSFERAA